MWCRAPLPATRSAGAVWHPWVPVAARGVSCWRVSPCRQARPCAVRVARGGSEGDGGVGPGSGGWCPAGGGNPGRWPALPCRPPSGHLAPGCRLGLRPRSLCSPRRRLRVARHWGSALWACLPDPKRALGAHGLPRFGEARLRRTTLTLEPCGARAGYTPPSADVFVLARCMGHGARDMQGTESGSRFFTGSVRESVAC